MSLAMGGRGGPVFTAVKEALSRNQGYGKFLFYALAGGASLIL
jgi:hypothetical protein